MLSPGGEFDCSQCGKCCDNLQDAPGAAAYPAAFGRLAATGWYPLCTEQGLKVWAWERPPMERAARQAGRRLDFRPNTVLLDGAGERVVVLLYELAHRSCPFLAPASVPGTLSCSGYSARPLVCRAYPVLLRPGGLGFSAACPSAGSPVGDDTEAWRRTYGSSFDAASAAAQTSRRVRESLDFLELVGELRPVRGLTVEALEETLARWPLVDLTDVLRTSGAMPLHAFLARLPPEATVRPPPSTADLGGAAAAP